MLNKNLLRYSLQKGKIIPLFLDLKKADLQELAAIFAQICCNSIGKSKNDLLDEFSIVCQESTLKPIVMQGLQKLALDMLNFESAAELDCPNFRQQVFNQAFELLAQPINSLAAYQNSMIAQFSPQLSNYLYADLPQQHRVTKIKEFTAQQLLNRYNIGLIQGLLLYCANRCI